MFRIVLAVVAVLVIAATPAVACDQFGMFLAPSTVVVEQTDFALQASPVAAFRAVPAVFANPVVTPVVGGRFAFRRGFRVGRREAAFQAGFGAGFGAPACGPFGCRRATVFFVP